MYIVINYYSLRKMNRCRVFLLSIASLLLHSPQFWMHTKSQTRFGHTPVLSRSGLACWMVSLAKAPERGTVRYHGRMTTDMKSRMKRLAEKEAEIADDMRKQMHASWPEGRPLTSLWLLLMSSIARFIEPTH